MRIVHSEATRILLYGRIMPLDALRAVYSTAMKFEDEGASIRGADERSAAMRVVGDGFADSACAATHEAIDEPAHVLRRLGLAGQ